jgi:tripartite ATP-independent transporter DctP family solute receptor
MVKKLMRRLSDAVGAVALVGAVMAGASTSASAQTLRLPHCCAVDSHFDVGAKKFAELLEQKTGGKMKVRVFPGGQLGQETEVIQNVQTGTIELTMIGHDPLAQFAPVTTILSMPYLFKDRADAFRLLDGPLGERLNAALKDKGFHVLGWGDNGARVYTNSQRPIKAPGDLAGLKIRSPQNPVNLGITKALGGIPAAMPYGEVYTAIQQHTIDGQENAVINIFPARLHEVQKFMTMTDHLMSFAVLMMSERTYSGLSPELRQAVESAGREAMQFQREFAQKQSTELEAKMVEQGVQVNRPDLAPFREATRSIHLQYVGKDIPQDLYDLVTKQ